MEADNVPSRERLKAHILYKLTRHNRWGAKHTEIIHVRSALPKERGHEAEQLAKELANEGLITWLPKTGQIHISLNSHRRKEILEIIEKHSGKQPF